MSYKFTKTFTKRENHKMMEERGRERRVREGRERRKERLLERDGEYELTRNNLLQERK